MALLVLLQEAWSARRDARVRFLKLQLEIVRSRLPGNRVIPDPVERKRLMKMRRAGTCGEGYVGHRQYQDLSSLAAGRSPQTSDRQGRPAGDDDVAA